MSVALRLPRAVVHMVEMPFPREAPRTPAASLCPVPCTCAPRHWHRLDVLFDCGGREGPSPPATRPPPTPTTQPRDLGLVPSLAPAGEVLGVGPHGASTPASSIPGPGRGSGSSAPLGVSGAPSGTAGVSVGVAGGDWTRGLGGRPSALPTYILTAPMGTSLKPEGDECESPMSLMIKAALQSASAFVQEQAAPCPYPTMPTQCRCVLRRHPRQHWNQAQLPRRHLYQLACPR